MPDAQGSSGWGSYLNAVQVNADEVQAERMRPPSACEECGEPLDSGPRGELFCPFDGWQWSGVNR